jgi:hypothetical protein
MAIQESIVENSYSAINGDIYAPGILSDSTLVVVLKKENGSNWDHEIYTSLDGGATWSFAFTIVTNKPSAFTGRWIGDKLYYFDGREVANTPLLFYRVDYNPATQTFSLGVNGATVRAAVASHWYGRVGVDKEPGNRLWCGYMHRDASWPNLEISYSDDDGATWTATTISDQNTSMGFCVQVNCLEKNTFVHWPKYQVPPSNDFLYERQHLHTDGVNTWSAITSRIENTYGIQSNGFVVKESASPCKRIFVLSIDEGASPKKIRFRRGLEDSSGAMTWVVPSDISAPASEALRAHATGRTDGVEIIYVFGGSLSTMRRRYMTNGGSNFSAESTWSLGVALGSITRFTPIDLMNFAIDAAHFVLNGTGSTGSYRPYVMHENLASGPFALVTIPLQARGGISFDSLLAQASRITLAELATIPKEALWKDHVQSMPDLAIQASGKVQIDAKIPLEALLDLDLVFADSEFAIASREKLVVDGIFAMEAQRPSDWTKEPDISDIWVKESGLTDDWAKEAAPSDTWVKE